MITTQTIYFTMKAAQEWLPMLRKMWRGSQRESSP